MNLVGLDLRSSAALIIAALISKNTSHIYGLEHLDRGYENFEIKLSQLGVQIKREMRKKNICKSNYDNSDLCKKKMSQSEAA